MAISLVLSVAISSVLNFGFSQHSSPKPLLSDPGQRISEYAGLPACAPIKGKPAVRAKSPDVFGAKSTTKTLACFPKADVDAGKKVLNGLNASCFACHGTNAQWPAPTMISNLRAQGNNTLSLANITAVNAAHEQEMGVLATAKQLKLVRAFLKCGFSKR